MALLKKNGFGQVEFNRVQSQTTKEIISTMPAANTITSIEMGSFVVPDYAKNEVKRPAAKGDAAYIVNNEIKNYEVRTSRKDFRLEQVEGNGLFLSQGIIPRAYKMHVGDLFHTNLVDSADSVTAGTKFVVDTTGILTALGEVSGGTPTPKMVFEVVKESTMPDGQKAIQFVCTKADYNN